MTFPFLSVITFTPLVAALIILMLPADRKNEARVTALAAAAFTTLLALYVYFGYDVAAGGYQFQEGPYEWIPQIGITYHMAAEQRNGDRDADNAGERQPRPSASCATGFGHLFRSVRL
jgi:NADH-quinone oxidoreductase subunit M